MAAALSQNFPSSWSPRSCHAATASFVSSRAAALDESSALDSWNWFMAASLSKALLMAPSTTSDATTNKGTTLSCSAAAPGLHQGSQVQASAVARAPRAARGAAEPQAKLSREAHCTE